jgi:hypothetical protein
MEVDKGLVYPY